MKYEAIKDANAGNSANTYWKPANSFGRNWCIRFEDGSYLRSASNKVRRFGSKNAAEKAVK
jgi:hypothetical protein